MAVVLFIISIPTETEEQRLRTDFLARKYDICTSQTDEKYVNTPVAQTTTSATNSSTATTVTINFPEATPIPASLPNNVSAETDGIGMCAKVPESPNTPPAPQYSTFPKRRKLDMANKYLLDDVSVDAGATLQSRSQSITDSVREGLNIMDDTPIIRKSWEGLRDILYSTKRKSSKKREAFELNISSSSCMEQVLREILKKFQIFNAVWTKDADGRMHQIMFTIEFNENYENILDHLHEWGIGDREGSTVSVMNCIVSKTFTHRSEFNMQNEYSGPNYNAQKQSVWNRFMNSVRSRLNVAQIVRDVRQDAAITFDFIILLISAAILASFGLIEDSTIFLASSMLVSPLMGPLIAGIFGTVIKDPVLRSLGLKNELIGIFLATIVGFVFGMVICAIDNRYSVGEGLTDEMMSRCELHSLVVGVFTAIPSGAAAAVAILGGNIGSLVGVAISASLLPPAVNSGVLWALALIYKFFELDQTRYNNVVKTQSYSENQAIELAILGAISMGVTISNVICVYIMGVLVLKVKEVAPVISQTHREFWKHDIKIARDLNKNGIDTDTALMDEFANLPQEDQKVLGIDYDLLRTIRLDEEAYQNTWSPIGNRYAYEPSTRDAMRDNYSTVHQIERIYSSINQQQALMHRRNRYNLSRHPTILTDDYPKAYDILTENLPRCTTMPTKANCPTINVESATEANSSTAIVSSQSSSTTTPTSGLDEQNKRRKFIITPAEDPLRFATEFGDIDI